MILRVFVFFFLGIFSIIFAQDSHAQYTTRYGATRHTPTTQQQKDLRILAFGDSLTEGYGIARHEAFPTALQQALNKNGYHVDIYNGGKSGDTTASGLKRIDSVLQRYPDPDLVILALGANDYLRRISTDVTQDNLISLLTLFEQRDIPVFLIGVKAYVHPSPLYRWRFNRIFPRLAKKHATGFMPDFLDGVAMNPAMNIEDGIHPNTRGVALMVDNTLPLIMPVLDNIKAAKTKP